MENPWKLSRKNMERPWTLFTYFRTMEIMLRSPEKIVEINPEKPYKNVEFFLEKSCQNCENWFPEFHIFSIDVEIEIFFQWYETSMDYDSVIFREMFPR